ncbi:aminotransferase [Xylariales sp. AK1849]|nr:aminotransferase [Xylariales sp. AK1849]
MADFHLFTSLRYDPALLGVPDHGFAHAGSNQRPSVWYMLDYHRDRMLKAATHWGWNSAIQTISGEGGLKRIEEFLEPIATEAGVTPYRVKILLDQDGKLDCEYNPVPKTDLRNLFPDALPVPDTEGTASQNSEKGPRKEPNFDVLIDSDMTAHTAFTHYKTTNRSMYDDARARHQLSLKDQKEVLIVNEANGSIMEGSSTTPFFWRNDRWITPPVSQSFRKGVGSGGNDGTTRRWALERCVSIRD